MLGVSRTGLDGGASFLHSPTRQNVPTPTPLEAAPQQRGAALTTPTQQAAHRMQPFETPQGVNTGAKFSRPDLASRVQPVVLPAPRATRLGAPNPPARPRACACTSQRLAAV